MTDWLKNHIVELTEAIRQIILVLVLFQIIAWTDQQIAGTLMAVSAILGLFVRSNTITVNQLDQRVQERVVQREAGLQGPSGTGTGTRQE